VPQADGIARGTGQHSSIAHEAQRAHPICIACVTEAVSRRDCWCYSGLSGQGIIRGTTGVVRGYQGRCAVGMVVRGTTSVIGGRALSRYVIRG
jgi:hypothetical protein